MEEGFDGCLYIGMFHIILYEPCFLSLDDII